MKPDPHASTSVSSQDAELVRALKLCAEGRQAYAEQPAQRVADQQYLLGQAAAFLSAARVIESGDIVGLVAASVPSWMWPKEIDDAVMGRHNNGSPHVDA